MRTTIRDETGFGLDEVVLETSDDGVKILYGHHAINATISLDWGEARELAEAILTSSPYENVEQEGRHERTS